ncbi:MAG TPA: type II secretion system minor pseudopilin GspI [Steroidobacteraceae bacterium]|nr:type II secretion system minor pseudopilin GspI [Steroidobacteraceae bacterium]
MRQSRASSGFTLVEVLVALVVVALGLTALLVAVNGTARTSGYLRDKTLAQWIALNRLSEVRLNVTKFGQNTDTGELDFGGRRWHYDTRYFDTSMASMKRVVVRVYHGDAKTKGNAVAQAVGFLGSSLSTPGATIADWTSGVVTAPVGGTPTPGGTIAPGPVTPVPGVTVSPVPPANQ